MVSTSQPRLLSFTLNGWAVLGGQVSVDLKDKVAVLVGRNGAGKSAILEGFEAISSCAIGRLDLDLTRQVDIDNVPKVLEVEILTPYDRRLRYRYELINLSTAIDNSDIDNAQTDTSEENQVSWNDSCNYLDGEEEIVWNTQAGVTKIRGDELSTVILGNTNSLGQAHRHLTLPHEMQWVREVLKGVQMLVKHPVHQTVERRPSLLRVSRMKPLSIRFFNLGTELTRKIVGFSQEERDELESVCQRVGLGSKIAVQKFVLSEESGRPPGKTDEEYWSVLLDGINLGLLSDGTLRVLSILIEIIAPSPSATIMIEEPEMQIHPGLLAKLLHEIEAYTFADNLILSTHAPQVVAWTKPDKINLVHRHEGKTMVRKLEEEEIQQVVEYLNEEGNLGDWLYSGILDD